MRLQIALVSDEGQVIASTDRINLDPEEVAAIEAHAKMPVVDWAREAVDIALESNGALDDLASRERL
jgi:hypothetical protein